MLVEVLPLANDDRFARRLRARMVRGMVRAGTLTDPRWRAAFEQVPRHEFLPRAFRPVPGEGFTAVGFGDRGWLSYVYSDNVLVTQLDEDQGRWAAGRRDGLVAGVPTSSSSMPTIMAVMLEALRVADGHRVLEIGTGTGYNTALLCHRLGDAAVTTVDVDPALVGEARARLARLGYRPACAAADGELGYPDRAPYHRLLSTCSVSAVPPAWLTQTRAGGLVVTTLNRPLGAGLLRITSGGDGTGIGRVLADDGRFMPLRAHRRRSDHDPAGDDSAGTARPTPLAVATVIEPTSSFEFFAGLELPGVSVWHEAGGAVLFEHPDSSWARYAGHRVSQGGPRRLWDLAERGYQRWLDLGRPRRERFGITVEQTDQQFWLDDPDSAHRWPLT